MPGEWSNWANSQVPVASAAASSEVPASSSWGAWSSRENPQVQASKSAGVQESSAEVSNSAGVQEPVEETQEDPWSRYNPTAADWEELAEQFQAQRENPWACLDEEEAEAPAAQPSAGAWRWPAEEPAWAAPSASQQDLLSDVPVPVWTRPVQNLFAAPSAPGVLESAEVRDRNARAWSNKTLLRMHFGTAFNFERFVSYEDCVPSFMDFTILYDWTWFWQDMEYNQGRDFWTATDMLAADEERSFYMQGKSQYWYVAERCL